MEVGITAADLSTAANNGSFALTLYVFAKVLTPNIAKLTDSFVKWYDSRRRYDLIDKLIDKAAEGTLLNIDFNLLLKAPETSPTAPKETSVLPAPPVTPTTPMTPPPPLGEAPQP